MRTVAELYWDATACQLRMTALPKMCSNAVPEILATSSVFIHSPWCDPTRCRSACSMAAQLTLDSAKTPAIEMLASWRTSETALNSEPVDFVSSDAVPGVPLILRAAAIRHLASTKLFLCGNDSQLFLTACRSESPHCAPCSSAV